MNPIIWEDMQEIEQRLPSRNWLKNKTVLVTGAYGMIASYLVYYLIYLNEVHADQNTTVVMLGRNIEKANARFGEYMQRPYVRFLEADLCQPLEMDLHVDYIVHAASLASPQYYSVNPVGVMLPNVMGTYQLLELARKHQSQGFLFFSSGEVYGKVVSQKAEILETDCGWVDPMEIRSCYSESKRMGEAMCKAWSHQYGVPACTVRIYHSYGPTMDLEHDARVFAEFVRNVRDGNDIIMKSDGAAVRPFCYLVDAVDAFLRILEKGAKGEAYNLANSEATVSIKELAQILARLAPAKGLRVICQTRQENADYLESKDVFAATINTDKLKSLDWSPRYSVEKGFSRTVRFFVEV